MPLKIGKVITVWKPPFEPLRKYTLVFLRDLAMLDTQEILKCTKFLIEKVHGHSLWLDRSYPMYLNDIHMLKGLSIEGNNVYSTF